MIKHIEILIPPKFIKDDNYLYQSASSELGVNLSSITGIVKTKQSIDARRKEPVYRVRIDVYINEQVKNELPFIKYNTVSEANKSVIIVGFGPAGMFAALKFLELGIKPIIFERGKDVQSRRKDLRAIQQEGIVNPDSNYCFGEGGAGTYSDGKLYTRSTKRGNVKKILHLLVENGADPNILFEAHPHIGSNKLPKIIQSIREKILSFGGEIYFNSRITGFIINNNKVSGVIINDKDEKIADAVVLATGHSARDIFYLLHKHKIILEPKPFAMGVRIEHPQSIIDEIQYHTKQRETNLPAATYSLACNINGNGVYSFCMCPGGIIVPSATNPGEIVVNGMSLSRRDSPFANSGLVVSVTEKHWSKYSSESPFGAMLLQKEIEQKMFEITGSQKAPAQKAVDFVNQKVSSSLPATSYIPGIQAAALHEILPKFIVEGLSKALIEFEKKKKGYLSEEAVLVAVESRTSSPVRIPRNKETFMHQSLEGLFPAGEGAGYAGGIVSSAIDGENCAQAIAQYFAVK